MIFSYLLKIYIFIDSLNLVSLDEEFLMKIHHFLHNDWPLRRSIPQGKGRDSCETFNLNSPPRKVFWVPQETGRKLT